ncbi:MAG: hypothetical protein Q3993_08090 [Filifactor alocis]|nr:hypothetical protein [Filifactor alocis]
MKAYKRGFYLKTNTGNNAFSFEHRKNKELWIPPLLQGDVHSLKQGDNYVFCEYDSETDKDECCPGLEFMIYDGKRNLYLFDNHNHSFYFIVRECRKNKRYRTLIHVDQHKDAREPSLSLGEFISCVEDLFLRLKAGGKFDDQMMALNLKNKEKGEVFSFRKLVEILSTASVCGGFELSAQDGDMVANINLPKREEELWDYLSWVYTNYVLNVGNFIPPLLEVLKFEHYYCVDSSYRMREAEEISLGDFILDLDLDFFSEDMDYISWDERISFVRDLVEKAGLITVATSPYFIGFERCKKVIGELFGSSKDQRGRYE